MPAVVGQRDRDAVRIVLMTVDGGEGDDTYNLDPGSTITIVDSGGDDTVDFADDAVDAENNPDGITVTLTDDGGTASDSDGTVIMDGAVETLDLTAAADTFNDQSDQPTMTVDGGEGDDTYNLDPGSTITIVDSGGDDTVDFADDALDAAGNADGITVTLTDDGGTASDSDGTVIMDGAVETLDLTAAADTFNDQSDQPTMTVDGGEGDDTYNLDPGSTITIVDSGGDDTVDFADDAVDAENNPDGITVTLTDDGGTASDSDGTVIMDGAVETLDLTAAADTFNDQSDQPTMTVDGGEGDDTYNLDPGSTITIVDSGGDDTVDFADDALDAAGNPDGITVTLTSDGGTASDSDGAVIMDGAVETLDLTAAADTFNDQTDQPTVTIDGGEGDDTYNLDPGSTITIVDSGGEVHRVVPAGVHDRDRAARVQVVGVVPLAAVDRHGGLVRLIVERVGGGGQVERLHGAVHDHRAVGVAGRAPVVGQRDRDAVRIVLGVHRVVGEVHRVVPAGVHNGDRAAGIQVVGVVPLAAVDRHGRLIRLVVERVGGGGQVERLHRAVHDHRAVGVAGRAPVAGQRDRDAVRIAGGVQGVVGEVHRVVPAGVHDGDGAARVHVVGVVAAISIERLVAGSAVNQCVVARATQERVLAITASQSVVSARTIEGVVARAAVQEIVARAAGYVVVSCFAKKAGRHANGRGVDCVTTLATEGNDTIKSAEDALQDAIDRDFDPAGIERKEDRVVTSRPGDGDYIVVHTNTGDVECQLDVRSELGSGPCDSCSCSKQSRRGEHGRSRE